MTSEIADLPSYPFQASSPLRPPAGFARLRDDEPVSRVRLATGEPAWLLTRYADIRAVLADPRLVVWFPGMSPVAAGNGAAGLLFVMDGPSHVRLRRLVAKALTPRRVENLRPAVAHIAEELVAAMTEQGPPVDLLGACAVPLSIAVLSELLGVPIPEREGFRAWSDAMLGVFCAPTPDEMADAGGKVTAFVAELIAAKGRQPDEDLLSSLIAGDDGDGDGLSDTQLNNVVLSLLLAGYVPPANALALAVLQLLRHPDQHQALREPALLVGAVEELLRVDQGGTTDQLRVATADVEIGGVAIRPGEIIVAPLRAANRDPAIFAHPDRFDITRSPNPHLSFAHGAHHCLGAALARLELQVGIGALTTAFPPLRLAVKFEELTWIAMFFTLNGPQALPIAW